MSTLKTSDLDYRYDGTELQGYIAYKRRSVTATHLQIKIACVIGEAQSNVAMKPTRHQAGLLLSKATARGLSRALCAPEYNS